MRLPRAAAPATTDPEVVTLSLYSDGHLEWDGVAVAKESLTAALVQRLAGHPTTVLRLAADGAVNYREVAEILSLAQGAGAQQLVLVGVEIFHLGLRTYYSSYPRAYRGTRGTTTSFPCAWSSNLERRN